MTQNDAASYCDIAFEAAQRALREGNVDEFKRLSLHHQGYAELYFHLRDGGRIQ